MVPSVLRTSIQPVLPHPQSFAFGQNPGRPLAPETFHGYSQVRWAARLPFAHLRIRACAQLRIVAVRSLGTAEMAGAAYDRCRPRHVGRGCCY